MTKFAYRTGIGYDVHRLVEGRPLILGGVEIPFAKGLLGHSDADCLIHAIMDALLGASGQPDIGQLFPDTDPAYENISSMKLLSRVMRLLEANGYIIVNVDAIVCAERPKINPYVGEMKANLARLCKVDTDQVNVKATTTEGLGFVGHEEGIACYASALLWKDPA